MVCTCELFLLFYCLRGSVWLLMIAVLFGAQFVRFYLLICVLCDLRIVVS